MDNGSITKGVEKMIETEMRTTKPGRFLLLAVFIIILAFSGWQFLALQYQPVDANDSSIVELRIPDNSSAGQVAALLKQSGLIRNEKAFLTYCSRQGIDTLLKAGLYELTRSQSVPEIAQQISQGKVKGIAVTIPEGYTVSQIGSLLSKENICTEQEWSDTLGLTYDYDFLTTAAEGEKCLEGFLFPDTYFIDDLTSPQNVIEMMLGNFAAVWDKNFAEQAETKQMSVGKTIIIASLIEREALVPEERKRIAGVIYNRLEMGMPLQIDATVLYSLGEHREIVTYKDLEIDSPYNTYHYSGLPPGPIASPGKEAIEAALNPEENNFYYYVAKGDGSHVFTATYAEHLAAKKNASL